MRVPTHMLDPGVRATVELLNSIDGVTTRASCEGQSTALGHRHSELAYVAFEFPIPARLQSFLVVELDLLARVDDNAVYCRWPHDNRRFLRRLNEVVRRYKRREQRQRRETAECPLSKLRLRLAASAADGREATVLLCLHCAALILSPHGCGGTTLPLLRWQPGLNGEWFGEFLAQPGNALDASLLTVLGTDELEERTRRGDFGTQFRRRWLRYRGERTQLQMTQGLRAGVEEFRKTGTDVDVTFDAGRARFTWPRPATP